MINQDKRNVNPIQEILRVTQNFSNIDTWDFKESYRSTSANRIIYDSEWCRMKIDFGGWDPLGGNSINIRYGRLHAPNENTKMQWNDEECHAWHRFEHGLHFLDGRSIGEAVEMNYSTPLISKYYSKDYREQYYRRQPEWLMTMHTEVWENYGSRFFELFDLRRPDLWEQYRKFLKEFYTIKGRSSFIDPPLDKVC